MRDTYSETFRSFFMGMFGESDGSPSCSRLLMVLHAIVASILAMKIVWHVVLLTDIALLAAWLGAMPLILGSLTAFVVAPYAIHKAAETIQGKPNADASGDEAHR